MIKKLRNDRLLKALARQPVDATPIWIMRQAGRYLPEYRQLRQQAGDFLTLCKTPELACQATLQPIQRFPLDAAILFSDILTIPDAMGLGLHFVEGEGPAFTRPIRNAADIAKLKVPNPESDLSYVLKTIRMIQHELAGSIPLLGFCGSPWTIATYMLEGKSNRAFTQTKNMLSEQPALLQRLLDILAQSVTAHLAAQITAGVDVVMIFDTWGGMLNTQDYQTFSLHYLAQIVRNLKQQHPTTPIILFTKGGASWLEIIADTGCDALGLDWHINIAEARQRVGNRVALQGNMDPALMHDTPARIEAGVAKILEDYGTGSGHVFNLGHGINKETPPEHVAILVEAVHNLSRKYHTT